MTVANPSTINHTFGYNLVNRNDSYQTPESGSYSYVYDKDRRLIQINFPSGNQISNIYDKTRLMQIQTPQGNIHFTYLCGTKVGSVTNGVDTIVYTHDGKLVSSETLTGTLNGMLAYTYNNDFNLTSFTYASDTHLYTYDDDGLLTGAGSFVISREKVKEDLIRRDDQDMNRSLAPLKPAEDATIIDTTELTLNQVVEKILIYLGSHVN